MPPKEKFSTQSSTTVSREGTTTLPGNVPADVRAERGKEPKSAVKDKSRETIMQIEIQDVIDIDREAEINCTNEDSELGVNETEVRSEETTEQVEIQDVIDIDRDAEINCTDEDSELGVNETEVRSEEDRNLKNIEELREQQTEVFELLRTLPRRSLREKRMPHRYQDYQMNSMVSEPYDTKLKIFNAVRSWHPVY